MKVFFRILQCFIGVFILQFISDLKGFSLTFFVFGHVAVMFFFAVRFYPKAG